MKKIKNTGINKKSKLLLKKMREIDNSFIIDIIISNMTLNMLKCYFPSINTFNDAVLELINAIKNDNFIVNHLINDLIKTNNKNVEDYLNINLAELEFEFEKDISPAYTGIKGISPDMMIFYYITNNLNEDDRFKLSIKKFKEGYEEFEKNIIKNKENKIVLSGIENTMFEAELNSFFNKDFKTVSNISFEDKYKELAEKYKAVYTEDKFILDKNILLFFDEKIRDIIATREVLNDLQDYTYAAFHRVFGALEKAKEKNANIMEIYNKNDILSQKNLFLEKEMSFLNDKIEELSKVNNNEELLKLEKENYYLKNKLEKIELEKAELLEEIENMKDIKEDISIESSELPIQEVMNYNNENIVIIGGFWDNKDKAEVQKVYFADFITAENVLKNQARIKNYDIVIFDTSKNSHINFFKCKKIVKNLLLISKSKKENIDRLFTSLLK